MSTGTPVAERQFTTTAPMGVIVGESEIDYRRSGCIGSTMLKDYLQSAEGFYGRYVAKRPEFLFKGNKGADTGTALHSLCQGEDAYRVRYMTAPAEHCTKTGLSTSKATTEWAAAQLREILTPKEEAEVQFLHERIMRNPVAARLMEGTGREVTGRVIDPYTGLPVQVRWDVLGSDWIADVKSTGGPISKFKWSVREFRYDVQAALYGSVHTALTGKAVPFYWIVVSTVYPFECRVIEAPSELMASGMLAVDLALHGIAAGDWGKPQEEPELLDL
jgi:hypothetical protein